MPFEGFLRRDCNTSVRRTSINNNCDNCYDNNEIRRNSIQQRHVHELVGILEYEGCNGERHTHQFATVTGEAEPNGCGHTHQLFFRTDYTDRHYHEYCGTFGPAINIGNGKHIHCLEDITTRDDNHRHHFICSSLIQDPSNAYD